VSTDVTPDQDSRLEQLTEQYDLAKAEAEKAASTFETIKDAIKLELMQRRAGGRDVDRPRQ
jgi:hypothetical protein